MPEAPEAQKLADIITYHLAEVESITPLLSEERAGGGDSIFEIKILPNRAHDLLSHQGIAREMASLLNIAYVDPTEKYKIPHSTSSGQAPLKIDIQSSMCRRYMGRIIRGVKVEPSPDWVVKHLESIGQRSINNMVDAANIVMFDCGQPTHVFDLNKIKEGIIVRQAKDGETMTTLDNKECAFKETDLVIADSEQVLAVAGIKGGKLAEVDANTTDIILEVANFDPTSVRKTAQRLNIFTDARKRFENDLSPELGAYAMREFSATILEMCPEATFEDVVDIYPTKQAERKLQFSLDKMSKILGMSVTTKEVKEILTRYNIVYTESAGIFGIIVLPMRLDLVIEEDMAEEIGRIMGYNKLTPQIPKIDFAPKSNQTRDKIVWARNKLLDEGYSEVMTYTFCDKGEVSVLASASDKKFLRTNISEGLKESIKLNNTNAPLLGASEIKVFEIGTVFKNSGEEINVAFGNKKEIKEMTLEEFTAPPRPSGTPPQQGGEFNPRLVEEGAGGGVFSMWSLYPFIVRDVSLFVPKEISSEEIEKVINENTIERSSVVAPIIKVRFFDEFEKDGQKSFAFRLIFQSYSATLTDAEVNLVMEEKIYKALKERGWQVR